MTRTGLGWDVTEAFAGTGGARGTANDLLTFLAAVLAPQGAFARVTALMLKEQRPTRDIGLSQGLGWHVRSFEERTFAYHNGGTGGFRSYLGFDPEARTAVVVLSNTASDADLADIGLHVLDRRAVLLSFAPTLSGNPARLDAFVGVYDFGAGDRVNVVRVGWQLFAKPSSASPAFALSAVGPTDFHFRPVDLTRPPYYRPNALLPTRLVFELDETGRAVALNRDEAGRRFRGVRVK